MSSWVAFVASVVGGAVAASAALGGVLLVQRGEDRRATALDKQRLRDAKAERLRRLYEPLMKFALVLKRVAREQHYLIEGDTKEARDRRHQKELEEGQRQVSAVVAPITVEPCTADVRAAYEATYNACDRYLRSLRMNAQVPGTNSTEELREQFDTINSAADVLEAAIRAQLQEFEQPI